MKGLIPLILCFGLMGCPHYVSPIVAIPYETSYCSAACQHLRDLKCPEGDPLPDGTLCEKFCYDTQKSGHDLHPECLAIIKACADQTLCTK
jgi:hypothetical protein